MFCDYIVMDLDVVVPGNIGRGMEIPVNIILKNYTIELISYYK